MRIIKYRNDSYNGDYRNVFICDTEYTALERMYRIRDEVVQSDTWFTEDQLQDIRKGVEEIVNGEIVFNQDYSKGLINSFDLNIDDYELHIIAECYHINEKYLTEHEVDVFN